MKLYNIIVMLLIIFGINNNANSAASCIQCGTVTNTLSTTLVSSENNIGQVKLTNNIATGGAKYSTTINKGGVQWWLSYKDEAVIRAGTATSNWSYRAIDEYISLAVRGVHPECNRTFYAPFNVELLTNEECAASQYPPGEREFTSINLQAQIKITKKIVTGVYTKNIYYADMGVCEPLGCQSKQAILQNLYINLNITVPQTCSINAGQTLTIDFGNISVAAFKTAGAKAEGVNPKISTLAITCDNIAAGTNLNMRLQANNVSGNVVVSNNNDVGFIVTDANDKPLIPNNLSSVIPFYLDNNVKANATIKVFPASVTGIKPSEGAVTSQAFLRIDFP
ncbi:fimbrial protein [Providencia burhodogranariea]|uniref:Fimbrial adhesin n=1 Tax=Providencia burhodogranariea DSM 19968 TaxID=1141662 RepID=K8WNU7_9GAMM|nr:fimbrial protein [Providencia burhodogranariea]EKT62283.1 fimbrial adhesin [Providencia burhodogranariea DSM 19968]